MALNPGTSKGSITLTWGPWEGFWHFRTAYLRHWHVAFIGVTYVPGSLMDDYLAELTLEDKP